MVRFDIIVTSITMLSSGKLNVTVYKEMTVKSLEHSQVYSGDVQGSKN